MVAINHEVAIPYLVELDWRQVLAPLERSVYALPLVPHAGPRRQEGPVEVPPSPHAANDLVHFYNLLPSVAAVVSRELSSNIVEGEQPV